ncbi:MAG: Rpn family recombination-promoting nuclease/putative transposase [Candidatus Accumulibacter sp.]|jgi:predicted transposase/invertase (TIGR01784 family)|nr:Rpn family recombination-promoting nuclease/putative transposase [Accumulibacter sp.]
MTRLAYTARNDAIFKMIFGDGRDIDILTAFLQAALDLPAEDYEEVTLIDPHLVREHPQDKLGILDVKVKMRSGKLVDVEIQICDQPQIRERMVFYLTRMVNEQIGPGDEYWSIKRSICILIANYVLVPENASYRNRYRLYDRQTGSEFTDLLEVNTLELPKLPRDEDGTPLWDWMKFLSAHEKEELEMLAEKNPQVKKAVVKLLTLSEDERTRMLADSREMLRRDISAQVHGAEQRGREEAMLSVARKLLDLDQPVDVIVQATGLPREVIQSLMH